MAARRRRLREHRPAARHYAWMRGRGRGCRAVWGGRVREHRPRLELRVRTRSGRRLAYRGRGGGLGGRYGRYPQCAGPAQPRSGPRLRRRQRMLPRVAGRHLAGGAGAREGPSHEEWVWMQGYPPRRRVLEAKPPQTRPHEARRREVTGCGAPDGLRHCRWGRRPPALLLEFRWWWSGQRPVAGPCRPAPEARDLPAPRHRAWQWCRRRAFRRRRPGLLCRAGAPGRDDGGRAPHPGTPAVVLPAVQRRRTCRGLRS